MLSENRLKRVYLQGDSKLARALLGTVCLRTRPVGSLQEVRVVADLPQDINASECIAAAIEDVIHLL